MKRKNKEMWSQLSTKMVEFILDASVLDLLGEEKLELVLDQVVEHLDQEWNLHSPIGEAASDAALFLLRGILRALIHESYVILKNQGAFKAEK